MTNWITLAANDCFHSPCALLTWYACNMDMEILCLKDLLVTFLTAKRIERIDLSDWPIYRLGTGVQEIEGTAPAWLQELDVQMGWNPSPHHTTFRPTEIIVDIAYAWDRIE